MATMLRRFGDRVRKLREEKNLSQEAFAFRCGLHRTYISDIERGCRNISLKSVEKIAKALGLSLGELFKSL